MGSFRRWLHELRNPAAKCARIGHRHAIERRVGYVRPKWEDRHFYVCMEETQDRKICRRCGEPLGEWETAHSRGFNSYSWPSDQARAFDRDGAYWDSQRILP